MSTSPVVSILTACYNSRKFINETIDSVLAQTHQGFEMLLVDDGPKETIEDIVASYNSSKLRYFCKENGGPASARNYGALRAVGDYVAFLDHDDLWLPTKLEDQLAAMQEHGAVWCTTGSQREDFYTGEVIEKHEYQDYFKNVFHDILLKPNLWSFSSVIVKKSLFIELGMFNPDILFMDDRDLYLRIGQKHPLVYLSKVLVRNKVHERNIGGHLAMDKILAIHETVLTNARKLEPDMPQDVIDGSYEMMHRAAVVQYLRANDVPSMRRTLKQLKFKPDNVKFIPYWLISALPDGVITGIMTAFRKVRDRFVRRKYHN